MRKTEGKYLGLGVDSTGLGLCSGCSSRGWTWWEARREERASCGDGPGRFRIVYKSISKEELLGFVQKNILHVR